MKTATISIATQPGVPARSKEAWTAFWSDPAQSRCASGSPGIWQALTDHWSTFAGSLDRGTRVLDLGCGAGIVGRLLIAARSDLRVMGIDSARIPLSLQPNLELLPETPMESLPFEEERFGAVVSQFGYEYGQAEATVREIARIFATGARLSFLVHHAESAVVAATRARLRAIDGLLAPATRAAFCTGDAATFGAHMAALVAKHPDDGLINELAGSLAARLERAPGTRVVIWKAIEDAMAPERCVSEALSACCVAPARLDEWLGPLRRVCGPVSVSVLREPDGTPIAWKVSA